VLTIKIKQYVHGMVIYKTHYPVMK